MGRVSNLTFKPGTNSSWSSWNSWSSDGRLYDYVQDYWRTNAVPSDYQAKNWTFDMKPVFLAISIREDTTEIDGEVFRILEFDDGTHHARVVWFEGETIADGLASLARALG